MNYYTDHIGTVLGLVLVIYWRATRNSASRKTPAQRLREKVPALLVLQGRAVSGSGFPALRRGHDCKIRFTATYAEVYRENIYRTDTYVGMVPYGVIQEIGWRNRHVERPRSSLIIGRRFGHTYMGTATRLSTVDNVDYTTFGLETADRSLIIECAGRRHGELQDIVEQVHSCGGHPVVQVFDR